MLYCPLKDTRGKATWLVSVKSRHRKAFIQWTLITGLISQNRDWNHQHLEFSTPDDIAGFAFRMWHVFFSAQQGGQCVSKVPYKREEEHPESLGLTAKRDSNKTDGDATWAIVQCGSSLQTTLFEEERTLRSSGRTEFHWDSPATQSPLLTHTRQTSLVLFSESAESEMMGVVRNEIQERKGIR